jgi:hypothetical protein
MRNLQGLNFYRGESYQEILIAKSRAIAKASNVKVESLNQDSTHVAADEPTTSETDTLEVMLLAELNNDCIVSNEDDPITLTSLNQSTSHDSTLPTYNSSSDNAIDYSIIPPITEPSIVVATNEVETDVHGSMNAELMFVNVKIEDDVVGSIETTCGTFIDNENNPTVVPTITDTSIITDEAMILPTIGSDQTILHTNVIQTTTSAIHEEVNTISNIKVESNSALDILDDYKSITPDNSNNSHDTDISVNIESDFVNLTPTVDPITTTIVDAGK